MIIMEPKIRKMAMVVNRVKMDDEDSLDVVFWLNQPASERIKAVIINMVHLSTELPNTNYSEYISKKLLHDYTYLSNVFSEVEGITIEHFIIAHKIEKVKELLLYGEYNITEIAGMLNYSNIAHLSNQFKKVTGVTPTFFKAMKNKTRISLEDL